MYKKKLTVKFNDTSTIKDKSGNKLTISTMTINIKNFFILSWFEEIINSAFILSALSTITAFLLLGLTLYLAR